MIDFMHEPRSDVTFESRFKCYGDIVTVDLAENQGDIASTGKRGLAEHVACQF